MKISRLALLLLLVCVVTSRAEPRVTPLSQVALDQVSIGGLGKAGSSAISPQTEEVIVPPTRNPDYSTYNKNPTFKRPQILSKPEAGYTEDARRNNVRGLVVLHVLLAETGQVTRISVVKGLPHGLTERAIAAARQITFEPAELEGKKVDYPMAVVYHFRPH